MECRELTEKIIGCAFRVHNTMGGGYLESVYENCLLIELAREGIQAEAQKAIAVNYEGEFVGHFIADLVVENEIIVELKSVKQLSQMHEVQLVNYLTATGMNIGLLINFGEQGVEIKRKYRTKKEKGRKFSSHLVHPSDPVDPIQVSVKKTVEDSHPVHPFDLVHPVQTNTEKLKEGPYPVHPFHPVDAVKKQYDFFLAGVIQGAHEGKKIFSQDYRDQVKAIVQRRAPGRSLFCPVEEHRASVEYADVEAREVFFAHLEILRCSRVMIAYLPTASMGTAVEMEICRQQNIPVIAITPLKYNWVVRLYSYVILPDLNAFEKWLTPENLARLDF